MEVEVIVMINGNNVHAQHTSVYNTSIHTHTRHTLSHIHTHKCILTMCPAISDRWEEQGEGQGEG